MFQLKSHFENDHRSHQSDWLRHQWFIKSRQDQEKRTDRAEKLEDELLSIATEVILATEIQIEAFNIKLDQYDEATVKALMENQIALDSIQATIELMLNDAYSMEDGRRVFKTENGEQVFDEFGNSVTAEELDFGLIPENAPTWEEWQGALQTKNDLTVQRTEIMEFQEKVDETREKVRTGQFTSDEIDSFENELNSEAPPSVKAQMPGFENIPDAKAVFSEKAQPAEIPTSRLQTQESTYDPMS